MLKTSAGTRMSTPHLAKLAEDELVQAALQNGEKTLTDDWKNTDVTPCEKCHGFGKSPEFPDDPFCLGCEGTGVHFILTYGVEDKKPYAYTDEYGIDFLKEVCKELREAFTEAQAAKKVGSMSMIRPYMLPKTLEMEFLSRGYTPGELRSGDKVKEIANIVARDYPDFLCVPYRNF